MKEKLINHYILMISNNHHSEISGCYLKKISQGISVLEVPEKQLQIVEKFPNIKKSIEQNQILQISKEGYGFYAIIGNHHYEGPYAEQEYLDVIAEEKQEDLLETLFRLDQKMADYSLNLSPKKAYRYYGMDKYK